jgi:putative oxidoreductase
VDTSIRNQINQIALTIVRIVAGFIFAVHGWQKINDFTVAGTAANFEQMGVPLPQLMGAFISYLEFIGGILLILGLLTRLAAILLVGDMMGAFFIVHLPAGFFVAEGGYELVLILGTVALALALVGPGKYSVDRYAFGRRESKVSVLA